MNRLKIVFSSLFYCVIAVLVYAGSGCAQKTGANAAIPTVVLAPTVSRTQASVKSVTEEPVMGSDVGRSFDRTMVTTLTDNASIAEGDDYGVVRVRGHHATVTITGGVIHELIVEDTNKIILEGGMIKEMYIYDHCRVVISGGRVGTVSGYGENTVTFKEKAEIETLHSYGATQIIVDSNDASIGTIQYFTKCGCVDQSQNVQLKLAGGRFGHIGTGSSEVLIHLTGYSLSKSAYGGDHGFGEVRGRWKDGAEFSIHFTDKSTFGHTHLLDLNSK
ncbi:MAG: hypothetical protein HQ515_03430 [Phycisphaeraceae bacterium]|nr:hypothetical protein [Phycisphaeraceae bacterium]